MLTLQKENRLLLRALMLALALLLLVGAAAAWRRLGRAPRRPPEHAVLVALPEGDADRAHGGRKGASIM